MKYVFVFVIFSFSFMPSVSGYTGIFSILDEKYTDNISNLPYSSGLPEMSWQDSGHTHGSGYIHGWIDIVGFRQMIEDRGEYFINGTPENLAIVQYGAEGRFERCDQCFMDSLKHHVSIFTKGNLTIAQDDIEMKWGKIYIFCDMGGCWTNIGYSTEKATFSDSEVSPSIYPDLKNGYVNVTEYNDTFNPKTVISINLPGNISKVTYRYGNDTLTHYFRQGHVEKTAKGVYFLNLSEMDFWVINNGSLQHFNNLVLINSSKPDYSKLSIDISSPYETKTIENYSYERKTYNSDSTFSSLLLVFVSTVSIFIFSTIIIIRRADI